MHLCFDTSEAAKQANLSHEEKHKMKDRQFQVQKAHFKIMLNECEQVCLDQKQTLNASFVKKQHPRLSPRMSGKSDTTG